MNRDRGELRRVGRRYDQRKRRADLALLRAQETVDTHYRRKQRVVTNWRVMHYASGEIVAVEPNRNFEHTFEGDDPFMDALEYAAEQIRKANEGD